GRFRVAVERFDGFLFDLLARRRTQPVEDSMLAVLLDQRDEHGNPPSDRHVRDELLALLVGGHDRSAASLASAFERLPPPPGGPRGKPGGRPDVPRWGRQGGPAAPPGAPDRPGAAGWAGAHRWAGDPRRRAGRGLPVAGHAPGGPVVRGRRLPARTVARGRA